MGDGTVDLDPLEGARLMQLGVVRAGRRVPAHRAEGVAVVLTPHGDLSAPEVVMPEERAVFLVPLVDRFEIARFQTADHGIGKIEAHFLRDRTELQPKRRQQRTQVIALVRLKRVEQPVRPERHARPEVQLILKEQRQRPAHLAGALAHKGLIQPPDGETSGIGVQRIKRVEAGKHQRHQP